MRTVQQLERWYLRRFKPTEDGFAFTQWGYDVHMSHAEVAQLRVDWRRVWMNPFLWGGWLALGVAFPAILYLRGSGVAAFMVALLFGVMMLVTLVHAHRRVNELAEERVPIEAARSFQASQPIWPSALLMAVLAGQWFLQSEGVRIGVWGLLFAMSAAMLVRALWRWWRARSVAA